jgi:hypothetical protein
MNRNQETTDFNNQRDEKVYKALKKHKSIFYSILKRKKLEEIKTLDKIISENQAKALIQEKNNSNKMECSICMNNDINKCCVPCGHSFCDKCIEHSETCFICQQSIFMKQKLFFS